jgi:hypothetical protein
MGLRRRNPCWISHEMSFGTGRSNGVRNSLIMNKKLTFISLFDDKDIRWCVITPFGSWRR